jgi:hypothetical protein
MKKEPVKTVQFYASEDDHAFPRPNLPVKPRISQDAWDIIAISALGGLILAIGWLVFS